MAKDSCEHCNGSGIAYFSCCTSESVDPDFPICPECFEHLGEEECICIED